jgi:micrococcal nuclease
MWTYRAIVKKIYDADTVTMDVDLGFGVWLRSQSFRLKGINAPEVTGIEKPLGIIARDVLIKWIPLESEVTIQTYKDSKEKYGRWLAEIFVPDEAQPGKLTSINENLVEGGYAERYMV